MPLLLFLVPNLPLAAFSFLVARYFCLLSCYLSSALIGPDNDLTILLYSSFVRGILALLLKSSFSKKKNSSLFFFLIDGILLSILLIIHFLPVCCCRDKLPAGNSNTHRVCLTIISDCYFAFVRLLFISVYAILLLLFPFY